MATHPDLTDDSLLASARGGDSRALETLLARYQPRVYRFGMRLCGHPEDARDVLQETMVALVRSLDRYQGTASLSSYLFAIARSFCGKYRRKSKFAPQLDESLDALLAEQPALLPATRVGPEDEAVHRELAAALDSAIAKLEPKYREVLVLRDVEGVSAQEVGDILKLSVQAVKSRLHRARLSLRETMAPFLETAVPAGGRQHVEPSAVRQDAAGGSMRGCPDVPLMFSRFLEGDIDAPTCDRLMRHLDDCPACRGACESLKGVLAMCQAARAPEVPEDVQRAVQIAIADFLAAGRSPPGPGGTRSKRARASRASAT